MLLETCTILLTPPDAIPHPWWAPTIFMRSVCSILNLFLLCTLDIVSTVTNVRRMRRSLTTVALVVLSTVADAWWSGGHMLTASVALKSGIMSDATIKKVNSLITVCTAVFATKPASTSFKQQFSHAGFNNERIHSKPRFCDCCMLGKFSGQKLQARVCTGGDS